MQELLVAEPGEFLGPITDLSKNLSWDTKEYGAGGVGMNPNFLSSVNQMADDFYSAYGRPLRIVSGYRPTWRQKEIYDSGARPAAKPGHSRHERGEAIDINKDDLADLNKLNLGKYGLETLARINDPSHVQMAGSYTEADKERLASKVAAGEPAAGEYLGPLPETEGDIKIPGDPAKTISSRQNNATNLKFAGQPGATKGTGDFASFETPEAGIIAAMSQVDKYKEKGYTLAQGAEKWFRNEKTTQAEVDNYVKDIAKLTGHSPDTLMADISTPLFTKALSKRESSTDVPLEIAERLYGGGVGGAGEYLGPLPESKEGAIKVGAKKGMLDLVTSAARAVDPASAMTGMGVWPEADNPVWNAPATREARAKVANQVVGNALFPNGVPPGREDTAGWLTENVARLWPQFVMLGTLGGYSAPAELISSSVMKGVTSGAIPFSMLGLLEEDPLKGAAAGGALGGALGMLHGFTEPFSSLIAKWLTRVSGGGAIGYTSARLEGAEPEEAGRNALLFGLFELFGMRRGEDKVRAADVVPPGLKDELVELAEKAQEIRRQQYIPGTPEWVRARAIERGYPGDWLEEPHTWQEITPVDPTTGKAVVEPGRPTPTPFSKDILKRAAEERQLEIDRIEQADKLAKLRADYQAETGAREEQAGKRETFEEEAGTRSEMEDMGVTPMYSTGPDPAIEGARKDVSERYGINPEHLKYIGTYKDLAQFDVTDPRSPRFKSTLSAKLPKIEPVEETPKEEAPKVETPKEQPMFLTVDDNPIPQIVNEESVRAGFGGADEDISVIKAADGDYIAQTPGGINIRVYQNDGQIVADPDAFMFAYQEPLEGRPIYGEYISRPGQWKNISYDGVARIAKESPDGTLRHEVGHAAFQLALDDAERAQLLKEHGTEEKAIKAYENWEPREANTLFQKVFQFFQNLYRSFFPNAETIFGRMRSGEVWRRPVEVERPDAIQFTGLDWKEARSKDEGLHSKIEDWLQGRGNRPDAPSELYRGVPPGSHLKESSYTHATPWASSAVRGGKGGFGAYDHDVYSYPATKDTKYYRGGSLAGDPLETTKINSAGGMTWDEVLDQATALYKQELRKNLTKYQGTPEDEASIGRYVAEKVATAVRNATFEADAKGKPGIWSGRNVPPSLAKERPSLRSNTELQQYIDKQRSMGLSEDKIKQLPEYKILHKQYSIGERPPMYNVGKLRKDIQDAWEVLRGAAPTGRPSEAKGKAHSTLYNATVRMWAPETQSETAMDTAQSFAKAMAEARDQADLNARLVNDYTTESMKLSYDEQWKLQAKMERNEDVGPWNPFKMAAKKMFDTTHKHIDRIKEGAIGYREFYARHLCADPDAALAYFSRPGASRGWEKHGQYVDWDDMRAHGHEPHFDNIVQNALAAHMEQWKYIGASNFFDAEEAAGRFIRIDKEGKPAREVPDYYRKTAFGVFRQGWADPGTLDVIHNHFIGDKSNIWFTKYRNLMTAWNIMHVAVGAFHAMTSTASFLGTGFAKGIPDFIGAAFTGDHVRMAQALKNIGPMGVVGAFRLSKQLQEARLEPGKHGPQVDNLLKIITAGGIIPHEKVLPGAGLMADNLTQLAVQLKKGEIGKAVRSSIYLAGKPIMGMLVPTLKYASNAWRIKIEWDRLQDRYNKKYGTNWSPETQANFQKDMMAVSYNERVLSDRIFGEIHPDNLHWSRALANGFKAVVAFPSWNLGTMGWIGSMIRGVAKTAMGKPLDYQAKLGLQVGLGLLVTTAIANTMMHMALNNGQAPEDWKDVLIGARTGRYLNNGSPERVTIASIMKDVMSLAMHMDKEIKGKGAFGVVTGPVEYAKTKFQAPFQMFKELEQNADYYGKEIFPEKGDFLDRTVGGAVGFGKWLGGHAIPFAGANIATGRSNITKFGPLVGIRPVPRYLLNTEAMNRIDRILSRQSPKARSAEAMENSKLVADLKQLGWNGRQQEMEEGIQEARANKQLSTIQIRHIRQAVSKDMRVAQFEKMKQMEDAIDVYSRGTTEERKLWRRDLVAKWSRTSPDKKRLLRDEYMAALALPISEEQPERVPPRQPAQSGFSILNQ